MALTPSLRIFKRSLKVWVTWFNLLLYSRAFLLTSSKPFKPSVLASSDFWKAANWGIRELVKSKGGIGFSLVCLRLGSF